MIRLKSSRSKTSSLYASSGSPNCEVAALAKEHARMAEDYNETTVAKDDPEEAKQDDKDGDHIHAAMIAVRRRAETLRTRSFEGALFQLGLLADRVEDFESALNARLRPTTQEQRIRNDVEARAVRMAIDRLLFSIADFLEAHVNEPGDFSSREYFLPKSHDPIVAIEGRPAKAA